jgi:hypothetical protein
MYLLLERRVVAVQMFLLDRLLSADVRLLHNISLGDQFQSRQLIDPILDRC